jgi:exo-beta-1,3-glucanase (GH17 family)
VVGESARARPLRPGFGSIKTYGVGTSPFSGNGNNLDSNQYNVQAANALGLGVCLGANLQFANGGLDLVRTKMEIDLAIKQATTYSGTVKTLIIGNESIGVNGVTVADMVSLMDYAKTQRSASGFTNPTNSLGTPNTANAPTYFNDYVAQVTASTFFFERSMSRGRPTRSRSSRTSAYPARGSARPRRPLPLPPPSLPASSWRC